ncbi:glycosyltransferase [Natrarchaeobaculum aegyptiacum]|uniref:Dolichol-P-glucose transferase n=1 Tax=Natrarchaeobaculum aegyptiacum TaxID=745377 RepID=A0A2Z2HZ58_9EURY|nr:glycosyltransferase [Natrarchaeobaculum aegyptiacum]ARS88928.1 dolichol-P-glucose transferase [Natrarchaeobaculum aegyptiacum]
MSRTVGLVIPAFRPDVDLLRSYVLALEDRLEPETILIELDEPCGETLAALEHLPATVDVAPDRRGKGAAVTAGFCALETEVLAFVDADGSTAVESVAAVVDRVRERRADLAVGSRRHPEADVYNSQSTLRERLGDVFAWVARRVLSVSVWDYQCGTKAIDAGAWAEVASHLCESGFAWDVELLAVVDALGYRIEEVPVTWADAPQSTVSSVGTTLELAGGLLEAHHRAGRLRGDPVHESIGRVVPEAAPVLETLAAESHRRFVSDDE